MNVIKNKLKVSLILSALFMWVMCMPVLAASDDNSLSALNVQNGTVEPEFVYSTWEYNVTVEPGTTELYLEPVTSDGNASITSITGTVLEGGEATVMVNTVSESGIPMTYTLHVREGSTTQVSETAAESEEAEETPTEAPTEAPTEVPTEANTQPQTETEAVATNALQDQVSKLKSDSDLMMKILYGLIALTVILLFLIINLILRNRDLKDDLKDAEDQLAYQTNEFARKEKFMVTDNYYAPTQQGGAPKQAEQPKVEAAAPVKEAPGKDDPVKEEAKPQEPAVQQPKTEAPKQAGGAEDPDKKDVNVTMVDL